MEKMIKLMCILALGAAIAVTTVSCEREEPVKEPLKESGIFVTVGAGIADVATKSEVANEDGKRVLKFTAGDKLYVCNPNFNPSYYLAGTLEMESESLSADGKSARFSGEVMAYDSSWGNEAPWVDLSSIDPLEGTTAYLIHAGTTLGVDYSIFDSYDYALYYLQDAADVETLMTQRLPVTGDYDSGTESYSLSCPYPIFNCTLSGLEASHEYNYSLGTDIGGGWFQRVSSGSFTTDANGNAHIAFLSYTYDEGAWELRIEDDDTSALVGTVSLGTRAFTSKVYNISRYWNGTEFRAITNLSTIDTSSLPEEWSVKYYTVSDGDILTGTFPSDCNLRIPDNATVVLAGMTHQAGAQICGINCEGSASIVLAAGTTNDLTSADKYSCNGIFVSDVLTISGAGTLMASGGDLCSGIGSSVGAEIVINGGTIIATGGYQAAGIGADYSFSVGDITINGGTITVTGGEQGGGIGCGNTYNNSVSCGDITFNGGTVTVYAGSGGWGIGITSNDRYYCGDISFVGGNVTVYSRIRTRFDHNINIDGEAQANKYINASAESPFVYPVPATP